MNAPLSTELVSQLRLVRPKAKFEYAKDQYLMIGKIMHQAAAELDRLRERIAWFENYVKACDNEVERAGERKRQWELEPPHCSSCSCGTPDVGGGT